MKQLDLRIRILNHFMMNGNKKVCEKIILKSLKLIQKTTKKNYKNIIKLAVINLVPVIHLKEIKKKKRKVVKKFPFLLNEKNRISSSIKSLFNILMKQNSKINLYFLLKQEILSSSQNSSEIIKKKKILQDYALTKKKYSYYRWFY